jgi:hypothetical protein
MKNWEKYWEERESWKNFFLGLFLLVLIISFVIWLTFRLYINLFSGLLFIGGLLLCCFFPFIKDAFSFVFYRLFKIIIKYGEKTDDN